MGLPIQQHSVPSGGASPIAPTALSCLRCQLLGRRRLLCSKVDACRELPHRYALGPILMVAWLVTVIAFVIAVR